MCSKHECKLIMCVPKGDIGSSVFNIAVQTLAVPSQRFFFSLFSLLNLLAASTYGTVTLSPSAATPIPTPRHSHTRIGRPFLLSTRTSMKHVSLSHSFLAVHEFYFCLFVRLSVVSSLWWQVLQYMHIDILQYVYMETITSKLIISSSTHFFLVPLLVFKFVYLSLSLLLSLLRKKTMNHLSLSFVSDFTSCLSSRRDLFKPSWKQQTSICAFLSHPWTPKDRHQRCTLRCAALSSLSRLSMGPLVLSD